MKLKKIAITNYRQFQNAVINFDDELTILAGANNSGKTSIIELFKRIFKDKNFSKEDISAEYYSKLQYDFISCINKIYNITDKETEFRENVKKEFSTENNNKWTAIKIKIEVQYDKNESISLFSDYLMELSDTCTSFFFLFNYEVNITELNKLLSLNATNLLDKKHEIQKLEAGRKTNKTRIKLTELQAEYEEFLKEIFDGALENRVYFADQNYENAGQISVREFQSLFNYNYLNATRLLNDEKTDNYFSISKELLSHFKKSNDWEEFKKQIIKDIKEGLKEQKLNEKVKEHSLIKAQNALDSIEKCFEYNKGEFSLQTDISDELLLGFLSSSLQTFFEFENGTKLKELPLNEKDARAIIERIGELQLEDGVTFKITSVKEIMEEFDYPGVRMMIEANLERMRQPFKIDISTDDAITPGAVEYKYKLMFEDRSISVLSYNLETLLAEKMQTILARGLANTRMRDFYDVYEIMNSKADQISFDVLKKAFAATCMKRETSFGEEEVRETLDKIKDDSGLEEMWNRFKRVNYFVDDLSWGEVSETIVDNIEKIFFLATRFLESVMKRE